MAIGQNDNHPDDYMKEDYNSERSKQWRENYKAFIEGLKKQYPEAKIVCCTTCSAMMSPGTDQSGKL